MKKTKIIQYITSLNDGGAETLVKDYCILLKNDGYDVVVIVLWLFGDSSNLKLLRENGIKICVLYNCCDFFRKVLEKLGSINHGFNSLIYEKIPSLLLSRVLSKEQPDIIHVHLELLKTLIPIRKSLEKVKLFYTCHSLPVRYLGNERPEENTSARLLIQYNNLQIIALHSDMAEEINQMFGITNTKVIKNGIVLSKYKVTESKTDIRKSLGIREDAFVVGHVGRFTKVKNHGFILNVFKELRRVRPKSCLLLVGAGELEEKIRNKISDEKLDNDVIILSHRHDVPRIMKAMDVFLFPSLYEGFGIVLIEAQASGLTCFVSDRVPTSTYVSRKVIPLSIESSPKEWVEEILHPSKFAANTYDLNDYNLENEVKKIECLYESKEDID